MCHLSEYKRKQKFGSKNRIVQVIDSVELVLEQFDLKSKKK